MLSGMTGERKYFARRRRIDTVIYGVPQRISITQAVSGFAELLRCATIRASRQFAGRRVNGAPASMLIPRFTIRALWVVLTVCAFVSVIAGMAVRGQHWAWGVTIGLLSLVFIALVHAGWFGLVWMLARSSLQEQRGKPARELNPSDTRL